MTLVVMSAKLVIHKIEDEINFKSIQIYLEQNETEKHEKTDWVEGKIEVIKSNDKDDADVVVKVVNVEEPSNFDLDYCAREIKEGSILDISEDHFSKDYEKELIDDKISCRNSLDNNQYIDRANKDFKVLPLGPLHKDNMKGVQNKMGHELENFLEHSLIKVKENNSRIWEKIQILNRTLNLITRKTLYFDNTNVIKALRSHTCSECEKCFVYETGLKRHFYLRHGNIDGPRWQTVWKCTECFQVWPQHSAAIIHGKRCCSPSNTNIVREIKTSLLLQCEFCEKVFTCIPKLLRHYKDHTVKYNYECKGCCMIFISYTSAEQHWMQCLWLKKNYTFFLPKMLLCNVCDRKFKNYEQLYNHRYKVCHFMGKSIKEEDLLNLVYQCEVCGQWFIETSLLEEHRNQQHP